jgi:hypothetical protein
MPIYMVSLKCTDLLHWLISNHVMQNQQSFLVSISPPFIRSNMCACTTHVATCKVGLHQQFAVEHLAGRHRTPAAAAITASPLAARIASPPNALPPPSESAIAPRSMLPGWQLNGWWTVVYFPYSLSLIAFCMFCFNVRLEMYTLHYSATYDAK